MTERADVHLDLVVDGEHAAVERILESLPHIRTARVSRAWDESAGASLLRAAERCRAGGWRVTDVRSSRGRVSVDLTAAPLPPALKWSRLEYTVEPCSGAVVRQTDDGLFLQTPDGEWSYGVVLHLEARALDQVRLSLECSGAPCEVATLASQTEIFHAATVVPAEGETVVALRIPRSLYGLVIRTGAVRGPSVVTVLAVSGTVTGQIAGSV